MCKNRHIYIYLVKPLCEVKLQFVVPEKNRFSVMTLAHATSLTGDMGKQRILNWNSGMFFLPYVTIHLSVLVSLCDICHCTAGNGRMNLGSL